MLLALGNASWKVTWSQELFFELFYGVVAHKAGLCDVVRTKAGAFAWISHDVWSGPVRVVQERVVSSCLAFTDRRSSFRWLERLG